MLHQAYQHQQHPVCFTFTAKETTDASAFTVSNLITENREELTTDNVTVKVVEKAEEPTKATK